MFFPSRMPCSECGASVDRRTDDDHGCEPSRWLEFQMLASRSGIDALEDDVQEYLHTREGRLETWIAERQVRSPRRAD